MYKLPPFTDDSEPIELPTCMYKMNKIYTDLSNSSPQADNDSVNLPEVQELEKRQKAILKRLEQLQADVEDLRKNQGTCVESKSNVTEAIARPVEQEPCPADGVLQDIVISASPDCPPYSLFVLHSLLALQCKVLTACHVHSSAKEVPDGFKNIFGNNGLPSDRAGYHYCITLIWKAEEHGPRLLINPTAHTAIHGEANIARFLGRLIKPAFDDTDPVTATQVDTWLDLANQLQTGNAKQKSDATRSVNGRLAKSDWLVGSALSIADVVVWSALQRSKQAGSNSPHVKKWLESCKQHPAFQRVLTLI